MRLRQGRRVGRTLYRMVGDAPSDEDVLVGLMDTPGLAAALVAAVNGPDSPPELEPGSILWQRWAASHLAEWAEAGTSCCSMCARRAEGMQISLRCGEHLGAPERP